MRLTSWSPSLPISLPASVLRTARFAAAVLLGALALAPAQRASAADTAATMEVTAGLRGWYDPGDHVVVSAEVSSDEVFTGRVEVVASSGAVVAKDIQVAGGTTKTVLLVAPTSLDNAPIDVRLTSSGQLVAKKSVALKIAEEVELVGVLPALATRVGSLPEQVNLATEAGKAQLAELSLDQMALGSSALEVFDTIVATTADVRSLQPDQRAALLGWINRGGRLLLDDGDAADLTALPAAWRPGVAGWALAGRGEVRLVDGAASSGRWASIIEPSTSSTSELGGFFGTTEQLGSVEQDLARRAGVALPSMVPLLVPLIAYWAIVSVILFVVLKSMRRMTLAWVAIPLIAVLTAGAVVWYGQQWRSEGKPAASVFVDGFPGGSDSSVSLLTFSRDGGTVKVGLPAGWQSDSEVAWYIGGGSDVAPVVQPGGDGTRLSVRLEPGQVTTASLLGPSTDTGLTTQAWVAGDNIEGAVTNGSTVTLHEVAIFGPGGAQALGTLAPGATAEFSIDADSLPMGFSRADRVWQPTSDPNADTGEIAEFGIWTNAGFSRVMYPSALVRAAGWTTELPDGMEIGGGHTSTTVLTSVAPIEPRGSTLDPATVRWSMARSPFSQNGNGTADTIYRYVVPPATQLGQRMVMELPVGLDKIELWNGTGWVSAKATKRIVTVPAADVRSGVVMARIPNDGQFFPGDQQPVLRGATSKDPA